jgi:hypothetical protein
LKWLQTAWQLIRDVLMSGTGLTLIMLQEFSLHPSGELIGAGLFLVAPAGIQHAVTVILSGPSAPGHGQESSSPSSSSPPSSPSPSPAADPGEGA